MSPSQASPRAAAATRVAAFPIDAVIVDAAWLGDRVVVASGDGCLRFIEGHGTEAGPVVTVVAHRGAVLCLVADPDGASVLTGGDDGRLVRSWPSGESREIACFEHRWVEHVAASPRSGVIACAVGKDVFVLTDATFAAARRLSHPSTVGGIALDPAGERLAASHYGGVSLWAAETGWSEKTDLPWAGSHLVVTWSPDGRFVVTAMQESALHGWRVADANGMHMQGYPTRPRSLAWAQAGRWLATSGADRVVCWPFTGKSGPMHKPALQLGPAGLLVTRVACHPSDDAIVAGYEDGSVLLLRIADDKGAVLQVAGGGAVSALAWSPCGKGIAFGTEDGRVGLLPLPAAG